MNTCTRCSETFSQWLLYQMHQEICKPVKAVEPILQGVKKPLSRAEKACIVAKGELRLGKEHFYGI